MIAYKILSQINVWNAGRISGPGASEEASARFGRLPFSCVVRMLVTRAQQSQVCTVDAQVQHASAGMQRQAWHCGGHIVNHSLWRMHKAPSC
jgi:hypothetical protein